MSDSSKMRSRLSWALYATSLPWDFVGWILVLAIYWMWGENLRWEKRPGLGEDGRPYPGLSALACDLKPDSWPARSWYRYKEIDAKTGKAGYTRNRDSLVASHGEWRTWGGTTLAAHAVFYGPGVVASGEWSPVQLHEHVHCEQAEAAMLLSFLAGLFVSFFAGPLIGFIIWWTGYIQMGVANWTTAVLRGESPYRGSHHEEAAYAAGDDYVRGHRS
jgi:hypothetical protein